jgi:glutathione S-transferase
MSMRMNMTSIRIRSSSTSTFTGRRLPRASALPVARRPSVTVRAYTWEAEVDGWEAIEQAAGIDVLDGFVVQKKGKTPRSSCVPFVPENNGEKPVSTKPVILYRDSNSVCPYCERVRFALEYKGIPYDTVYIDLSNRPKWLKGVSEGKLPVAYVHDELYVDSSNIIAVLERAFPDTPSLILSKGHPRVAAFSALMEDAKSLRLYKEVSGAAQGRGTADGAYDKVKAIEDILAASAEYGPFLCGDISMADVVFAPFLERMASYALDILGFSFTDNPDFPHLGNYLAHLNSIPAFARIRLDSTTARYVTFRNNEWREGAVRHELPAPESDDMIARREAAAKIAANLDYFVENILMNSGLCRGSTSPYGSTMNTANGYPAEPRTATVRAIDYHLRRVCQYLVSGEIGPKAGSMDARCLGAVALVWLRSGGAVMAPRDMNGRAAEMVRMASGIILDHCL